MPPRILAIIERRKELGLTQEELAKRAGFSVSLMAKIERGAVDPRSLSTANLVGLAKVLGLPLSVLLDERLEGLDEVKPLPIPVYANPDSAFAGQRPDQMGTLAPEDLPRGALWERLIFLELPCGVLVSPSLPFSPYGPSRLLVEMRPLLSPKGVYVGRYQGHPALFTQQDVERGSFPLYPLVRDLPTLWVEGEKPEVLGLVRAIWTWL